MSSANFWTDRPVYVTGAAGLVGSHLVRRLVCSRADVVCLLRDRDPRSMLFDADLVDQVRVAWGDAEDQALNERILGEFEIRTVFHLAAQAIVSVANRNAVSTFESNVAGTWSLLEACRRSPLVGEIVVASSDKAYGEHGDLPYTESTPLAATHPYDVSKACADLIATSYAKTFDVPVAITRCGNFFGPGDLNWNRIVPGTIRSVLRGQRPVIRSDGRFVRDYFFVEDGAAAYMTLAEELSSDPALRGEAFNFSNDDPLAVTTVVERILNSLDSKLEPVILNEANHEIRDQYLCSTKARAQLGWSPMFSFEEGLARTVSWYEKTLQSKSCPTHTKPVMLAAKSA